MRVQRFAGKNGWPRETIGNVQQQKFRIWKRLVSILILVWAARGVWAEPRIQLVGGTARSCKRQVQDLQETLLRLPIANNWTFVIACTPVVWDNMSRRADALGKTTTAFTNLEARYTFFNGGNISPQVVAHEFGHILGPTRDEEKAQIIGMALLRQSLLGVRPLAPDFASVECLWCNRAGSRAARKK